MLSIYWRNRRFIFDNEAGEAADGAEPNGQMMAGK